MPIYQNKEQVSRSKKHIDWLKSKYTNVTSIQIELNKTFGMTIEVMKIRLEHLMKKLKPQ